MLELERLENVLQAFYAHLYTHTLSYTRCFEMFELNVYEALNSLIKILDV